eukprot:TRINITY_DN50845_c0_g1_i1.p1 TRINITY_DN50845_c0_g1~~TRINITY_DN50845_c0_g1_i1.p1  ORF type:complete len:267 (+),score=106.84 TRINITY_DN50845_c0_g1_i1:74-874(+)
MGCGASGGKQEEKKGDAPAKGLTQEEKNQIATEALKDALSLAIDHAITHGIDEERWKKEDLRIGVPIRDDVDANLKKAREFKLPMIGTTIPGVDTLCGGIEKAMEPFEDQFRSAAIAVVKADGTKEQYKKVVSEITVNKAIKITREGGVTACVDYLEAESSGAIKAAMEPIVEQIMKDHMLTKVWTGFIEKYNSLADAAGKVPKAPEIPKIEFNLNQYVMTSTLTGIKKLMMEKEKQIREAPGQAVSSAIQQVFGGKDPDSWEKKK